MSARRIETDALVVGSGGIGATYARLMKPHVGRVTMIDSGAQLSRIPGEHVSNPYVYQHQPNLSLGMMYGQNQLFSIPEEPYRLEIPRGELFNPPVMRRNFTNPRQNPNANMLNAADANLVGGAFALWSCFAPTPVPWELQYFVDNGLIDGGEWEALLPIANRLFNTHTDAFEPSAVSKALRAVFGEKLGRTPENTPMAAEFKYKSDLACFVRWTGSDTVLGPLLQRDHPLSEGFELLPEHRAEELVWKDGRVEHCKVRDLANGELMEIHAEVFVVAGNAFPTPRLLWKSGIRPNALGRYLTEHVIATASVGLNNDVIAALRADGDNPARGEVVPIAFNDASPKIEFAPTVDRPWISHINRTARYLYYTQASWDSRLTLDITSYGPVEPNPNNRVMFADDLTDRFGQPQISFEYRISAGDAARAELMMDDLMEAAGAIGEYLPIETSAASAKGVAAPFFQPPGTSWHWMGTYRMGPEDDGTCVVDRDSRVWGFDNLYLGGGGVIPNEIASNPTLMECAIAAKSVAKITGRSIEELANDVGVGSD